MLDSPEGVCAGQARFEYPATFVLFGYQVLWPFPRNSAPSGASGALGTPSAPRSPRNSAWRFRPNLSTPAGFGDRLGPPLLSARRPRPRCPPLKPSDLGASTMLG
jgi:hypothetical protein